MAASVALAEPAEREPIAVLVVPAALQEQVQQAVTVQIQEY